ncbi:hypothetical protein AbraIFM66950_004701 [Aspergillus brasiliensis]|nr:hypothetical protein AbraIFM66950_004701 [Aspergillus brasiliensis]
MENETFVDAFVDYAKIVLAHYADRVPIWVTFNEPLLYSFNSAGAQNVIHAQAQVYHFFHHELKAIGRMGIKFNDNFGVPQTPNTPPTHHDLSYIANTSYFFDIDPYTATVVSPPPEGIDDCAANDTASNTLWPYCVVQETQNV